MLLAKKNILRIPPIALGQEEGRGPESRPPQRGLPEAYGVAASHLGPEGRLGPCRAQDGHSVADAHSGLAAGSQGVAA